MGSKRENLKKSLGITEYPWSSDDEDEPGTQDVHVLRRQTAEPRPSVSDMPGTSGLVPQPWTSLTPPRRNKAQAILNQAFSWGSPPDIPNRASSLGASRSRLSEVPLSSLPRTVIHTPAPELRDRGDRPTPRADVQRVIAFKKLTRGLNNLRQSNSTSNLYSMSSRGNNGPLLSSEVSSNNRSNANPSSVQSIYQRFQMGRPPPSAFRSVTLRMPGTGSEGVQLPPYPPRRPVSRSYTTVDLRHAGSEPAMPHVNADHSDDDADNPIASSSVSIPRDETNLDQNAEAVASPEGGGALEEDVVEIDGPEEPTAFTAIDLDAVDNAEEPVNNAAREVKLSESAAPVQSNHGIKRKRDGHEEGDPGPVSVNEFNHDLLRLLECPVCLEWMEPPISQCRRGHLVCGRCRERLAACPVCRTTFSSVRNRAMEGVAELLRYPCRHGCGRELRLRRRAPHEASCCARKYTCPAPLCPSRQPLAHSDLGHHFQSKHLQMVKIGSKHRFSMKVNSEQHHNWVIFAWDEYFHLRIDVDIRTWGVIVYAAYIGPKWNSTNFTYEVTVDGQHNSRKLVYTRVTHSDLESSTVNVSRQDCFHLTLDQALNFLRFKNRHCEPDKYLDFDVEITKCNLAEGPQNAADS